MANVIVVMVTYGDRLKILKKSVPNILNFDISKLLIFENDISNNSKEFLSTLCDKRIIRIQSKINIGSSGGFHDALEYILNNLEYDFVWLLDDDNFPIKNCLNELLNNANKDNTALVSNRIDRNDVKPNSVSNNNFIGINIFKNKSKNNEIICAPYGGLFIPKKILQKINLPIKKLFVYGDDHVFTYRIYNKGFKFKKISKAIIRDMGDSHNKNSNIFRYFQSEFPSNLLYFQIRNHTFLSKIQKTSLFMFCINMLIFLIIIIKKTFESRFVNFSRWMIILKGINHGLKLKI